MAAYGKRWWWTFFEIWSGTTKSAGISISKKNRQPTTTTVNNNQVQSAPWSLWHDIPRAIKRAQENRIDNTRKSSPFYTKKQIFTGCSINKQIKIGFNSWSVALIKPTLNQLFFSGLFGSITTKPGNLTWIHAVFL